MINGKEYQLINVPADGSCFYTCYLYWISHNPILYNKYIRLLIDNQIENEHTSIMNNNIYKHCVMIRELVSKNITMDDFEMYQILCSAEPENEKYENIDKLRNAVTQYNEHANLITIQILYKLFNNHDIVIYSHDDIQLSPIEWTNNNSICMYFKLLNLSNIENHHINHYNILLFNHDK